MSALLLEAAARQHAPHGFHEVQTFQGKVCWKEDPELAALSDDDLAQLDTRIAMSGIATAL